MRIYCNESWQLHLLSHLCFTMPACYVEGALVRQTAVYVCHVCLYDSAKGNVMSAVDCSTTLLSSVALRSRCRRRRSTPRTQH
jgi:hypothetical protein